MLELKLLDQIVSWNTSLKRFAAYLILLAMMILRARARLKDKELLRYTKRIAMIYREKIYMQIKLYPTLKIKYQIFQVNFQIQMSKQNDWDVKIKFVYAKLKSNYKQREVKLLKIMVLTKRVQEKAVTLMYLVGA